jgi:hypothetical protein
VEEVLIKPRVTLDSEQYKYIAWQLRLDPFPCFRQEIIQPLVDYILDGFQQGSLEEFSRCCPVIDEYFTQNEIKFILAKNSSLKFPPKISGEDSCYPNIYAALQSFLFDLTEIALKREPPVFSESVLTIAKKFVEENNCWKNRQARAVLKLALAVIQESLWKIIIANQNVLAVEADPEFNQQFLELCKLFKFYSAQERASVLNSTHVLPTGYSHKTSKVTLFSEIKGIYSDRENAESLRALAVEKGVPEAIGFLF